MEKENWNWKVWEKRLEEKTKEIELKEEKGDERKDNA